MVPYPTGFRAAGSNRRRPEPIQRRSKSHLYEHGRHVDAPHLNVDGTIPESRNHQAVSGIPSGHDEPYKSRHDSADGTTSAQHHDRRQIGQGRGPGEKHVQIVF